MRRTVFWHCGRIIKMSVRDSSGAFHGQKGYQGNLGLHDPPTPPRLPILLLFLGTVFLIRVTLGYQHRAQGTHLPQGYLGNLFARETQTLPSTMVMPRRRPLHGADNNLCLSHVILMAPCALRS